MGTPLQNEPRTDQIRSVPSEPQVVSPTVNVPLCTNSADANTETFSFAFVELCCGSANLCKAFAKKSVSALGIDHRFNKNRPSTPYIELDLSTGPGQMMAKTILDDNKPDIVHAGPPCGTASRARERPISKHLLLQGAPSPRPLRTEAWPEGIPGLSGIELAKVQAANAIYNFVLDCFLERYDNDELFSLENPETSLFWCLKKAIKLKGLPKVLDVCFSQCVHGGTRPVRRRWLTNIKALVALVGNCPGVSDVHVHAPFRIYRGPAGWKFDTAEEATYPEDLCQKYVKLAEPAMEASNRAKKPRRSRNPDTCQVSEEEHAAKRRMLRSSIGLFIRGNKYPMLIPEFTERKLIATDAEVGSIISCEGSHFGKVLKSKRGEVGELAEVGIFRTPEEFIQEARLSRHPIDLDSFLPEALCSNIFFLLTTPPSEVARQRLEKVRMLRQWASELAGVNDEIHKNLSAEQARVSFGKHFAMLRKVLQHINYPDVNLVDDLIRGTSLTGTVPQSYVFPRRNKEALSSVSEVLHTSQFSRESVLSKILPSGDHEVDCAVYDETCTEEQKGWISGPIDLKSLASEFGNQFVIAKRFGIRQSGKIRCIDDYSISAANSTVETLEKLDLYGCDEVFAMLKLIVSAVGPDGSVVMKLASGKVLAGRIPEGTKVEDMRNWKGKTFDLKSAYRQIHLAGDETNKRFSVIALWNPHSKSAEFRKQYATPFGSIASVYLFNRASRAIWAIGCFLHIAWGSFFDDFPCVEPTASCDTAELAIRSMCLLLGWNLALDKSKPFESSFSMLGIITDLTELKQGIAKANNKPERLQEIASTIKSILSTGSCPKPLVAELRGRAQYASAQISGRLAVGTLNGLANHQYRQRSDELSEATVGALERLLFIVTNARPRELRCLGQSLPILVFTDGAVEGDSITMGAVVIDTANQFEPYQWGGPIDPVFVNSWRQELMEHPSERRLRTHVIAQAELLPVVLVKWAEAARFQGRRIIYFVDNDGARHSLIKGWSSSQASNQIIEFFNKIEIAYQSMSWFSRVPSKSNPADEPSRGNLTPGPGNAFARVVAMPKLDPNAILLPKSFSLSDMD